MFASFTHIQIIYTKAHDLGLYPDFEAMEPTVAGLQIRPLLRLNLILGSVKYLGQLQQ